MKVAATVPVTSIHWKRAVRIIRSIHPPIDLFEDIADPADWPLLIAAEQKTNPRLMESIGNLDLVPVTRRVSGAGASYLMAPFTHISMDRPSRFSDGTYGVLYAGETFEVALFETIHHHACFMRSTNEPAGWTSQFREIVLDIAGMLHDITQSAALFTDVLHSDDYGASQRLGQQLRSSHSEGIVYPSVRHAGGMCAGLFHPDLASHAVQGRHLDYHWNGSRVDLVRNAGTAEVFRLR